MLVFLSKIRTSVLGITCPLLFGVAITLGLLTFSAPIDANFHPLDGIEAEIEVAFPSLTFTRPVLLTHAGDGSGRVFVVEQAGRIRVLDNDEGVTSFVTFLDITSSVSDSGNEEGLLGLAFAPDYETSGEVYVHYSVANPRRSRISRFGLSEDPDQADEASEEVVLEVPQPFANHNGGAVEFGPDGYLYIALGDGGSGGDPLGHGQDTTTLLGSILRIDVNGTTHLYGIPPDNPLVGATDGSREEIWAYGLRNPWRMSFDPVTDRLWVGDVGQGEYEEIDLIEGVGNYGWNTMEGFHCFSPPTGCNQAGLTLPVAEYDHSEGCSVTGGHVYRGTRVPALTGAYLYGDYCSGRIWALRHDGNQVTDQALLLDTSLQIASFGVDGSGELYIAAFDGNIYRFVAQGLPAVPAVTTVGIVAMLAILLIGSWLRLSRAKRV